MLTWFRCVVSASAFVVVMVFLRQRKGDKGNEKKQREIIVSGVNICKIRPAYLEQQTRKNNHCKQRLLVEVASVSV